MKARRIGKLERELVAAAVPVLNEIMRQRMVRWRLHGKRERLHGAVKKLETEPCAKEIMGLLRLKRHRGAPTWSEVLQGDVLKALSETCQDTLRSKLFAVALTVIEWLETLDPHAQAAPGSTFASPSATLTSPPEAGPAIRPEAITKKVPPYNCSSPYALAE